MQDQLIELIDAAAVLLSLGRTQGVPEDEWEAAEQKLEDAIAKAERVLR